MDSPNGRNKESRFSMNTQLRLKCAFHPEQKITNFCKNPQCLLPMCPRCVKIHTQQHMRGETHGDFDTISQCIRYCQQEYTSILRSAKQITSNSQEINKNRLSNIKKIAEYFNQLKKDFIQTIQNIFDELELQLNQQIKKDELIFSKQLNNIDDSLSFLINMSKKGQQALQSSHALETLIQFHAQTHSTIQKLLQDCKKKLAKISINQLQIKVDYNKLRNASPFIRQYILISQIPTRQVYDDQPILSKSRQKKPVKNQSNDSPIRFSNKLYSGGLGKSFQSPLDTFDLKYTRQKKFNSNS